LSAERIGVRRRALLLDQAAEDADLDERLAIGGRLHWGESHRRLAPAGDDDLLAGERSLHQL
jgi:hypothetical protein